MLANTLALGVSGTLLNFDKRYPDKGQSVFSVAGLAPTASRTLTVSHTPLANGSIRTLFSLDEVDVDPASTSTVVRTGTSRLYVVIQRTSFKTAADVKAMFTRLKTMCDSTALQDQLLNQEV
jgi:hypothetical protein